MKSSTRLLSLVLAMLMIFSLFSVAVSAKEIDVTETAVNMTGGEVLYLDPNSNWEQANARFACYFFGSGDPVWASMEACPRDAGIYKVTVPSGNWTNVIFCRMDPGKTTNDWNSKWNQSGDLKYDGTNNLCKINSGQWDCGSNVTWSVFTETPAPTEAPVDPSSEETPVDPSSEEPSSEEPSSEEPSSEEESSEEPSSEEPVVYMTTYCINSGKWDTVTAYAWTSGGDTLSWPGEAMTKTEETVNGFDVYEITLEGTYENVIFNNNDNGLKTDDLTFEEGKYYDVKTKTWYDSLADVPAIDTLSTDCYILGEFNGWSSGEYEFKLKAEGEAVAYVTLTLEANTTYQFKIINGTSWTSCSTPITDTVEGLSFSSSVGDNAKITTKEAGEYVFAMNVDDAKVSVTYPVVEEPSSEEPSSEEPSSDEPSSDEPSEDTPVIPAGYYLVGTLNGVNFWFVDENSADRMLSANEGAEGEYMLKYTFVEGDEIKVVYFDGKEITKWYNDGGDNYGIGAAKAGSATLYFRPDGNDAWSYYYFTVVADEVPSEEPSSDEESSDDPFDSTDDQPTVAPDIPSDEPSSEEPYDVITVYFQNNWLWSDVRIHYWGSEHKGSEYPGDPMDFYDNDGTYDVYMCEIPADVTGLLITGIKDDGTGTLDKTPDITEGIYDGVCYYMTWDNGNSYGSADIDVIFPPVDPPSEDPSSEEPSSEDPSSEEPSSETPVEKIEKVTGVTVSDETRDSFKVSWDAAEGVAAYWVYVDGEVYASTTDSSIVVEGRKVDTAYEVFVRAAFEDGTLTSFDADVVTAQTKGYEYTSEAEAGCYDITFNWTADGETKTWIFYGTSEDDLKIYDHSTTGTYTLTDLESETTYFYKFAHLIDNKVVYTEVNSITTLADDNLVVTSAVDGENVTISWNSAYDANRYWIVVETPEKTVTYFTTDTTYTIEGAAADEYTITVKGATAEGKMVYYYPVEA